jgi:hypothetical protein
MPTKPSIDPKRDLRNPAETLFEGLPPRDKEQGNGPTGFKDPAEDFVQTRNVLLQAAGQYSDPSAYIDFVLHVTSHPPNPYEDPDDYRQWGMVLEAMLRAAKKQSVPPSLKGFGLSGNPGEALNNRSDWIALILFVAAVLIMVFVFLAAARSR